MLEVHQLNAFYGQAQALFDVSLRVQAGEMLVLQGLNGAGKSTLLKAIMGLEVRTEGQIRWQTPAGLAAIEQWGTHRRAQAGLGWPREPRFFKACGKGPYDRQLLQPFTLVWLSGKVTGQAEFAGTPIPVIEIDALYRGSDCLEGDTAPQCVHSYLQPLKKPQ